jgi:hypothetical protein
MRPMPTLGLVLVILGALALILQVAGVFSETLIAIGPLEVEQERSLPWLPWVAGGAILIGIVMMVSGRRT